MEKPREPLPFDVEYFRKLADRGIRYTTGDVFTRIYESNLWSGRSSKSGQGSDGGQTGEVAAALKRLVSAYGVRVLLDLPCGDFNWMKSVDLDIDRYIGGDIVPEIIALNRKMHGSAAGISGCWTSRRPPARRGPSLVPGLPGPPVER